MTPIEAAREYVQANVQRPALSSTLPQATKNKIRHSDIWLGHFKRVGDLLAYLRRFNSSKEDPIYLEMKSLGLRTYEDIVEPFAIQFAHWASDRTRQSDFVIGDRYSAHDILIYAGNYDTRAGGMFVMESGGKPSAVVIKATMTGGKYANEWLEKPVRLKYFFKSKTGKDGAARFGDHFKPNAAILNTPDIPVLTFARQTEREAFTYAGVFNLISAHTEPHGSKWFELGLSSTGLTNAFVSSTHMYRSLEQRVRQAAAEPQATRLARLAMANPKPTKTVAVSVAFDRNPDVIAEVLFRAAGKCGGCGHDAPFVSKATGNPYLEVHHRLPLSQGGDDSVDNAIALCPNCHRERHFGRIKQV